MPVPHWDSTIRLAPGAKLTLDADSQAEWTRKTEAFRTVRGTILAVAFEIEHSIDVVISRFFFPTSEKDDEELKLLFDELFLKSSSANFSRKIHLFKKVSEQPVLSSLGSSDLLKNLHLIRDLRNRFAHYPIVFDPSASTSGAQFVGKLICSDKEITLDEGFFVESYRLWNSIQGELQKVLSVFGVPKSANPSSPEGDRTCL